MSRFILRTLPVLASLLVFAACGDNLPTAPNNPEAPTTFTEVFSGTVGRNGAQTHPFATQASGQVTATIKALVPDNTVRLGLALGTWNGSSCQIVIAKDDATEASVVIGAVSALGNLCVRLYDVGGLVQPTEYQVEVVHP